jgi:hypothetical protein
METINNNNNIPNQNNSKYQPQPNELFDLTPQPKEPENQLLNNQNFTDEPFLFFFIPFHIDVDFLCGCSLYIGIKLIAFILIFASLFGIYTTLTLPFHIFNTMFSLLITVLYLIAGFYLFKSTITFSYDDVKIGYFLYACLVIYDVFSFLLSYFLISVGIINPYGGTQFTVKKFVVSFVMGIFSEIIKIYLVWIIYCYMVHIKVGRINLVLLKLPKQHE